MKIIEKINKIFINLYNSYLFLNRINNLKKMFYKISVLNIM